MYYKALVFDDSRNFLSIGATSNIKFDGWTVTQFNDGNSRADSKSSTNYSCWQLLRICWRLKCVT